jgi:protein TonB
MHRIVIRLLISVLTFSVGLGAFALVGGLLESVRSDSAIPPISTDTKPFSFDYTPAPCVRVITQAPVQVARVPQEVIPKAPISGGVLNGKALSLPKPAFPPIARAAHVSGTVWVQVLVDEEGSVISARAVSGHPLLQHRRHNVQLRSRRQRDSSIAVF